MIPKYSNSKKKNTTMYSYEPKSKAAQPPSVEVVSFREFAGDSKKLLMAGAA